MATDVCRRAIWRLACTWLLMATDLLVACVGVVDAMTSASAVVVKRSLTLIV